METRGNNTRGKKSEFQMRHWSDWSALDKEKPMSLRLMVSIHRPRDLLQFHHLRVVALKTEGG